MIRFENVSKRYPRSAGFALDRVSFTLNRGEFAFLTGASGAGKSHIPKLSYMDELPTAGNVRVAAYASDSIRRREIPRLRRRLGIVFQDFRLLDDRTAEQNVAF